MEHLLFPGDNKESEAVVVGARPSSSTSSRVVSSRPESTALATVYEVDPHLSMSSIATTDSAVSGEREAAQTAACAALQGDDETDCGDEDVVSSLRTPINSTEFPPGRRSGVSASPGSNRDSTMPHSIYLPSELLPVVINTATAHPFESVVESTLQRIGPVDLQIQHRQSVVLLMKRLVRLALGSTAYEYGVQTTRCLLPDDPIKLTVILSKSLVPTWHTTLSDYLTSYAERASAGGGSSFLPPDEDEVNLDPYFNDLVPSANHFLGNVTHVKQNLTHSVTLIVDSIVVDITANNRSDLCLTAFLEEVSTIFGQHDDLFKRSLLLVRAWWGLETHSYVGTSIRHYLTDNQLFVMLAGVFNQYSAFIKNPMAAFCFFLAEYSGYDGISRAVTIKGLAPFQTKTSNQPSLPDAKPFHVIPDSLFDRYWVLYNISYAQEHEYQKTKRTVSSDDEDSPSSDVGSAMSPGSKGGNNSSQSIGALSAAFSAGPLDRASSETTTVATSSHHNSTNYSSGEVMRECMKTLSQNNIYLFDRSSFNIVHPLAHTNMVTEKLSQRRISRLMKAFQTGAVSVATILRATTEKNGSDFQETMSACFSNIRTYVNLWNQTQQPIDLTTIM